MRDKSSFPHQVHNSWSRAHSALLSGVTRFCLFFVLFLSDGIPTFGQTPTTYLEGAENGLGGVVIQTSAGYNPVSNSTFADGPPHSFHFAHPDNADQWMALNTPVVPQAGTTLNFKSRLGWAGPGQTARVQVSTNSGASWTDIYTQAGSGGAGELAFVDQSIALGAYAGQSIRIRFLYSRNTSLTTFSGVADSGQYIIGWFVDLITVSNPGSSLPVLFESGENGTNAITIQTSAGYNPLSTRTYADGPPHAFHLAHPDSATQWIRLNTWFVPQGNSVLSFKSRLGWAGIGQTARVQVSTNNGISWEDVYIQTGTDSAGELSFSDRSVSLASFAGSSIQIRFAYTRNVYLTTFSGTADSGQFIIGWFVDLIAVSNVVLTDGTAALPVITQQPQSTMAAEGEPAGFTVNATGPGNLTYQWLRNGQPIAGANSRELVFSSVAPAIAGQYTVVASNSAGSASSLPAALSVFSVNSPSVTGQDRLTISGSVTNPTNVGGIRVNGVDVVSNDSFSTWTAAGVSLNPGPNTLSVSATQSAAAPLWTTVSTWEVFRATQENLLPFAFNSANGELTPDSLPQTSLHRDPNSGQDSLMISYRRRVDSQSLDYLIEISEDLISWRVGTPSEVETLDAGSPNADGVTENVVVKILPVESPSGDRLRFGRLKVNAR